MVSWQGRLLFSPVIWGTEISRSTGGRGREEGGKDDHELNYEVFKSEDRGRLD